MTTRSTVGAFLVAVLVLVVAVLLLGQFLGQPILLSYVETGSMEPTLEPGEGFVAIPAEIAGPIEEGDIVTFEARALHGGGLITHRVVERTEHGYITKGDANPSTDQAGQEPHVTDGQIVAKALQIDGEVVAIPHLGTAAVGTQSVIETSQVRLAGLLGTSVVLGTQGLAYLLFTCGVGFLVIDTLLRRNKRIRDGRQRTRARKHVYSFGTIVLAFALLIALVALGTMVVASSTHEYGVVSASFESERANVIPAGETEAQNLTLQSDGVVPMVSIVEPASDGVVVNPREHVLTHGSESNVTLSLSAPPETGFYLRSVVEYRYFAVLPPSVISALHSIHPWLALSGVTAVLVVAFTLPSALLIGTNGRIRVRERTRKTESDFL